MTDEGDDDSGGRGRLSRAVIADAALRLVDRQGVATTSLRGVAAELGFEPMSLYRYVANRDDLFDAVVDRVVDELDDDPEVRSRPVHGWQDYLARLAHGVRRYGLAHPHAFPIVATRPSQAPWINPPLRSLRWIESLISALADEGFDDEQILFVYRSFNSFLLGFLLLETSAMTLACTARVRDSGQHSTADDDVRRRAYASMCAQWPTMPRAPINRSGCLGSAVGRERRGVELTGQS